VAQQISSSRTSAPTQIFNCDTTSKIIGLRWLRDANSEIYNLDYILADHTVRRLCPNHNPNTDHFARNATIPPDDGIFSVRICYSAVTNKLLGIRFTAISRSIDAGTITPTVDVPDPRYCYDVQSTGAAPLAGIGLPGQSICNTADGGLNSINTVCWNRYYVSPSYFPPGGALYHQISVQ